MAEATQSKRQREDDDNYQCKEEDTKRHKSYNHILSILEQEEDEPSEDLLDIFQILQQELSSSDSSAVDDPLQISASAPEADHQSGGSAASESSSPSSKEDDDEEDDKVRMMRHLLEASDDELGLPNRLESGEEEINSVENPFFLGDGLLWELEDDAANYYTLLQSELFM